MELKNTTRYTEPFAPNKPNMIRSTIILVHVLREDFKHIKYGAGFQRVRRKEPTFAKKIIMALSYEFVLVIFVRVGQLLTQLGWFMFIPALILRNLVHILYGCDIDTKARIGSGIRFFHPFGIVISGNAQIGKNTAIFNSVTIGKKHPWDSVEGPIIIGDNCILCSGSKILGPIEIANNIVIGANVVITNFPQDLSCLPKGCSLLGKGFGNKN